MADIRGVLKTDKILNPVLVPNLKREEYQKRIGLNPSSMSAGLIGSGEIDPTRIKMAWEKPDAERTAASQDRLNRGTLAHLLVLQPELLLERVAIWKGGARRGGDYEEFQDANNGKLEIIERDYASVSTAVNAMRSQPMVAEKIRDIQTEVAMFGSETVPGLDGYIAVKGQVDAVQVNKRVITDLKTTEAGIDKRSVERTVRQFHYREKMAMYRRWLSRATGTEPDSWRCFNLFMSLTPPYGVRLVKYTSFALDWGEARMLGAIESVAKCLAADEFPMYCIEDVMDIAAYESESDDDEDIDYDE